MRRATIVVLALALLLPAGVLARGAAADPADVPGLEGPAQLDRDANGIAHIRAGTRHDLFFLQGWVHAQDRLFQMDTRRRQADGTLAELLGPAALGTDVYAESSLPGGPSGVPGTPWYVNLLPSWLTNDTYTWSG